MIVLFYILTNYTIYMYIPIRFAMYTGQYIDCALWLYICKLPPPHTTPEWSQWYLQQLVREQGWALLTCSPEAIRLKNGRKCPAFALVIRNLTSTTITESIKKGHNSDLSISPAKEVLLIIRGSRSPMDWAINLHEVPVPLTYYRGPLTDVSAVTPVEGFAHQGMICVYY